MPIWFCYATTTFGILFFVAHLGLMLHSLPFASDRDTYFEFLGKAVPGFAGILITCAVWVDSALFAILLNILAGFVMILGRAVYELIIFRGRSDS